MLDLTGKSPWSSDLARQVQMAGPSGLPEPSSLQKKAPSSLAETRTVESTAKTRTAIEETGAVCDVFATDATSSESVKSSGGRVSSQTQHGRIQILLVDVGPSQPGCPATMSEETWDSRVELNLKTVYLACHHVLPVMEQQATGGSVVCVSSIACLRYIGKPQIAYNTTEAAVMQFAKATAVMYAPKKDRPNTLSCRD